jgi:nitroreductase
MTVINIYYDIPQKRDVINDVHPLIASRHSPRAMSGEDLSDDEINSLFEAARWAPSAYNNQPWLFIFAKKNTISWDILFNLLVPFNQEWCKNAGLLVVMISAKTFAHNGNANPTHSYDTGSAWANLALQGVHLGLVTHGISGFDYQKTYRELEIPENYAVEAMIAVGRPAPKEVLDESLQANETLSQRNRLESFMMEGKFQ